MTVLQEAETLKKTPLYDRHVSLGGKIVNFGGWALPIQYTSILAEHKQVRDSCGFFDVSHLGEIRVTGKGAGKFLQSRLTNDIEKIADGFIQYNLLLDEKGHTLDDVLVYRDSEAEFYVIVNAANIDLDFAELVKYAPDSVKVEDKSDSMACIAVQGPNAEEILTKIFRFNLKNQAYYTFSEQAYGPHTVWISRSGYTGEDGFEIFSPNDLSLSIWDSLVKEGAKLGALPCGLGARNTLRLEAGNALFGNDINRTTTPLEAGLMFAVDLKKPFVGRDSLLKQKEKGPSRKLVGFKMLDKAIAREHYPVLKDGKKVGEVTSGSFGPTAGINIGLAYVPKSMDAVGTHFEIEIHGRPVAAEIVKRPFVPLKHKR